MADRTTIDTDHARIDLAPHARGVALTVRTPIGTNHPTCHSIIETPALLAAIDAADPDAMRAYLRETLAAIPEADSPEDVDEHCRPLTDAQRAAVLKACRDAREALQR